SLWKSLDCFMEQDTSTRKSLQELGFFIVDDILSCFWIFLQFRECFSQQFDDNRNKRSKESRLGIKFLSRITDSTTKNSSKNVSSSSAIWSSSIGESNCQSTDVISDNTISHINSINVFSSNFPGIWTNSCSLLNGIKDRSEEI